MILGFPDETEESIARTLELAMEFNPDMAHFLAIAPWPYADIYKDLEPYIAVRDYRKYNLIDPIIKPRNMTLQELDKAIVDCYRAFYMNRYAEMMLQERDEFKKKYMVTAMKLMMSNSFIKKKIGATMSEMPEEVRRIIESVET
jgi:anaerobic magnesium-protoporphyrin IX monomethyl ester cyclase